MRSGISCQRPSLCAVAVGVRDARSRSAACSDRNDCQKLIETLRITIVTMIDASTPWPIEAEMAPATSRMMTSGFANRWAICPSAEVFGHNPARPSFCTFSSHRARRRASGDSTQPINVSRTGDIPATFSAFFSE